MGMRTKSSSGLSFLSCLWISPACAACFGGHETMRKKNLKFSGDVTVRVKRQNHNPGVDEEHVCQTQVGSQEEGHDRSRFFSVNQSSGGPGNRGPPLSGPHHREGGEDVRRAPCASRRSRARG